MSLTLALFIAVIVLFFFAAMMVKLAAYEKKRAKDAEKRNFALEIELKKIADLEKKQEAIENDRQKKTGKVSTGHALSDFNNSLDVLSNISAGH